MKHSHSESAPSPVTSADAAASVAPAPRAPLAGVLVGVALALGLVGWTGSRISEAKRAQADVAEKRSEDASQAAATANKPRPVSIVLGKPEPWQPRVEFDGTVTAAHAAGLGFKVGGRLASVKGKLGDVVKAGTVLATLDTSEASAQLRSVSAQERAAQAQLALALDSAGRNSQMVATGSLSAAAGVQSTQQQALAEAQLETARAGMLLARVNLQNHTLTAPFRGTLTRVPEGVGGVVPAGAVQFELLDLETLKLKGTIAEADAALVQVGSTVEVPRGSSAATGTVTSVLGAVDAATRRVPIEAVINNSSEKNALRAGTLVHARIQGGSPVEVLRLPHATLRPGSQDEVMVVRDAKLVASRIVFTVAPDGALLVRAGLSQSDAVVLAPRAEAATGDSVHIEGATP